MIFPFKKDALALDEIEIDGNGRNGYLFGTNISTSNGMEIAYWKVFFIEEDKVSPPIDIDDYGLMGYATQSRKSRSCMLFGTTWRDGWEPKLESGLYIVGQWYELKNGDISQLWSRPAVYRRYGKNLERLRNNQNNTARNTPLLWFNDKDAHPVIGPYPFTRR